jgi:hypothetical protein
MLNNKGLNKFPKLKQRNHFSRDFIVIKIKLEFSKHYLHKNLIYLCIGFKTRFTRNVNLKLMELSSLLLKELLFYSGLV